MRIRKHLILLPVVLLALTPLLAAQQPAALTDAMAVDPRITIGRLGYHKVGGELSFGITAATTGRVWTVHSKQSRTLALPTPKPPFRVEVHISPLFVPARLDPRSTDRRHLGAQVTFAFRAR